MGLMIRSSSIHAAGCYTTSAIPKGAKVVEYTGPRISKRKADAQFKDSTTTCTTATKTMLAAIAGPARAARPCTRRKRSPAARKPQNEKPLRRQANVFQCRANKDPTAHRCAGKNR